MEDRRRKIEDGRQETEDRRRKIEVGRQETEDGRQKSEDGIELAYIVYFIHEFLVRFLYLNCLYN